jgi:hypothetical protein
MQAEALTALVGVLVKAGLWDRAEQAARAITNSDMQAQALKALALALMAASTNDLAGTGERLHVRACRLLADVLAGPSWLEALRPLGRLDPVGMVAVYDAFLASSSGDSSPFAQ